MKETKVKLTALIIVLNGERTIDACLQSLAFCDSIVVIDSFSTDRTKEICLKHGAHFIENPFKGYMEQIRFGIEWIENNAPSEWIFFLDCDEICSAELQEQIKNALSQNSAVSAYQVSRLTWYYDRFLYHGGMYPDRLFRLFKPEGITVSQKNGHPIYVPTKEHGILTENLLHYSNESFFHQMQKLNVYAQRGTEAMQAEGRKGGLGKALFHSFWRFFAMYFIQKGFLDGKAGFINACHIAFYTFLKYIRVSEGKWGEPFVQSLSELSKQNHKRN